MVKGVVVKSGMVVVYKRVVELGKVGAGGGGGGGGGRRSEGRLG